MEIRLQDVDFYYMKDTPFEKKVLHQINLTIPSGSFTAIIGHTGSGKSTLIQHFNGLLKPSAGKIQIGKTEIEASKKTKNLKELRKKVGLVFQYPEHQLFEETVLKDICYGPMNFGITEKNAIRRAKSLLPRVGLSEELLERSPFELSGGQMRRAAIAGVLALEPNVLVLDEPTAGLDPKGRKEIMDMFYELHQEKNLTTVLVTHNMSDAAIYADQIIVLHKGKIISQGKSEETFLDVEKLQNIGLDVPESVQLMMKLEEKFQLQMPRDLFTTEEVADYLYEMIKNKGQ